MNMRLKSRKSWWLVVLALIAACSSPRVVPESLEPLVDRTVTFREVVAAPDSYQGKLVIFGGEVLKAKRLKDGTQIEFLQLPLDKSERPMHDRQQSQGRFLAIQQEFLDPATIVEGTTMTIVGELSKAKVEHLDDVEYRYPVVIVKHLHTWPAQSYEYAQPRPRFSIGIGGGTGGRIGGGGGFGIGF
jgi:outer membrane lipoprotein